MNSSHKQCSCHTSLNQLYDDDDDGGGGGGNDEDDDDDDDDMPVSLIEISQKQCQIIKST